jgi:NADH-quinone oxidoreductase subunit M
MDLVRASRLHTMWLLIVPGAPLAAALVLILVRSLPPRVANAARLAGWIAGIAAVLSLAGISALLPALESGNVPSFDLEWIPAAGVQFSLRFDWLALPFLITQAGVTLLAVIYAWGYHHADERTPFFYAFLMLFAVGMSGTILAGDVFVFYVFWELMLVASCTLIAVWGEGERRGAVALKYFIFTHLGSLLVLVGLILLYSATGNASFAALQSGADLVPGLVQAAAVLLIVGFCVKMAVFPLHLWLPDAHTVAPMPVTIMLAAAMLSMGAYGILRFPLSILTAAQMAPFAVPMMVAGIVSELYGALMALAEQDIKRIIAYSSVSQMGYVLFGLGTLTYSGIAGATLHVVYHGIVKALLFMCIGLVIRATGRRRITELGGLGKAMPLAAVCASVGALAISGAPPFCIFASEWMIFAGGFHTPYVGLAALSLFGSLLTVGYALWFAGRLFFAGSTEAALPPLPARSRSPWAMAGPTTFLAVLALVEGLFPAAIFRWVVAELASILGGNW